MADISSDFLFVYITKINSDRSIGTLIHIHSRHTTHLSVEINNHGFEYMICQEHP